METEIKPIKGMGCILTLKDDFPYTIIEVINDRKIIIQSDESGIIKTYTKRNNGLWAEEGYKRVGFLSIG